MGGDLQGLGLPGIGRVVFGFLITVGLAVGAAYGFRRLWPGFLKRAPLGSGAAIRTLTRAVVSRTLSVHVVEVDGVRVMIAESRGALGLTVLPPGNLPPVSAQPVGFVAEAAS